MEAAQPAKLLRLHFAEHDKHEGKPLYQAIVEKCRQLSVAGATVFRGLEGYGETAEIHRARLLGHDLPIIVTIVDSEENVTRLLPVIESMMDKGLIVMSDVQAFRIRRDAARD